MPTAYDLEKQHKRAAFESLMAEWRMVTAAIRLNEAETGEDSARFRRDCARQAELRDQIVSHPTRDIANILPKLEVLEMTLKEAHDGYPDNDRPELAMIGCIRDDLLRLEYCRDFRPTPEIAAA
ncbi:MAG TPA: hypothetical protein PK970_05325 [Hyphomicrobiaceae bacterium]|nr:hypothetical protein [Hyphomicrobiaceae bacterium]